MDSVLLQTDELNEARRALRKTDPTHDSRLSLLQFLLHNSEHLTSFLSRPDRSPQYEPRREGLGSVPEQTLSQRKLKAYLRFRDERRRTDPKQFLEWPAWDMLLDLASVETKQQELSVSAICISSGAPQSTALRKLSQLAQAGLVRRFQHEVDKRRICVELTESGRTLVRNHLQQELLFFWRLAGTD